MAEGGRRLVHAVARRRERGCVVLSACYQSVSIVIFFSLLLLRFVSLVS
jgi:hypothetical protein